MQFFWFFYINKRTGGVGAKPPQTKNLKNIFNKLIILKQLFSINFFVVLFPAAKRTKKCN